MLVDESSLVPGPDGWELTRSVEHEPETGCTHQTSVPNLGPNPADPAPRLRISQISLALASQVSLQRPLVTKGSAVRIRSSALKHRNRGVFL